MTQTTPLTGPDKKRPRRIAADEAHSWARNLRLSNPYAKLVLSMLTLYVQADGHCFVGIEALAEDTELSADTVRKRLAWLEGVGAIARFPQWIDASGRRNGDGNGKRTTDEIRLLVSADVDMIERRALGDSSESTEPAKAPQPADDVSVSPRSQQGLNPTAPEGQDSVSPRPALCQPSDSGKGLDSSNLEPEPKDSPQSPPSGGIETARPKSESEPQWPHTESWAKLEAAWNDPILHQQICRDLWTAFSDVERERFIRVVRGYLAWRLQQRTVPNRCNMQKLMREIDAWAGFEKLAGPDPALRTFVVENSEEHHALQVISHIGGWKDPLMQFDIGLAQRGLWVTSPLRPDELAMAIFRDKPVEQWASLERGTPPFYAWSDRLFEWLGTRRTRSETMRVPCLFPPRKDGTIASSTDPPKESSAA